MGANQVPFCWPLLIRTMASFLNRTTCNRSHAIGRMDSGTVPSHCPCTQGKKGRGKFEFGHWHSAFAPYLNQETLTSWRQRFYEGTFPLSADCAYLRFVPNGGGGDLENCVMGPIGARIIQKRFQTHSSKTRLMRDSILMSNKTRFYRTKNKRQMCSIWMSVPNIEGGQVRAHTYLSKKGWTHKTWSGSKLNRFITIEQMTKVLHVKPETRVWIL